MRACRVLPAAETLPTLYPGGAAALGEKLLELGDRAARRKNAPLAEKLAASDGFVIGSPVYYGSANGTLVSLLDRLFYSNQADLTMKVGASVAVARRGGCSSTFDELNKYFTIAGMPVASSQYWNMVYGMRKGEAQQDLEGMRTMRVLAENMSFLMKSIALGKEKYGLPVQEDRVFTNFIR